MLLFVDPARTHATGHPLAVEEIVDVFLRADAGKALLLIIVEDFVQLSDATSSMGTHGNTWERMGIHGYPYVSLRSIPDRYLGR